MWILMKFFEEEPKLGFRGILIQISSVYTPIPYGARWTFGIPSLTNLSSKGYEEEVGFTPNFWRDQIL